MCTQGTCNEEEITDNQQITIINEGSNELAIDAYLLDLIDRDELRQILSKTYEVRFVNKEALSKLSPVSEQRSALCFCGKVHGSDFN